VADEMPAGEMPGGEMPGEVTQGGMVMRGDMRPYPAARQATPQELASATSLWRATRAYAARFASLKRARKLGYELKAAEIAKTGYPGVFHARRGGARFTGRLLYPKLPQALMYWCTAPKRCTLIGVMYRAPSASEPPTYGPMLMWHKHANGRTDGTWMTHVWLSNGVRAGFARCVPWPYLQRSLGVMLQPWGPKNDALAECPTGKPSQGGMPMG
jgi:hypothetical protein